MRKSIRVSLLVMVMAVSAYAGDMQCGVTGTPPPPPAITEQEQTTDGHIPNGTEGDVQSGAADSLTETVLSLLAGVLALV